MRRVKLQGFSFYRCIPPEDQPPAPIAQKIRRAIGSDDPDASFLCGEVYFYGRGTPLEETVAVEWYRHSAELGSIFAKNNLAVLYLTGKGIDQSDTLGLQWLQAAAKDNESAAALENLGLLYQVGRAVKKDVVAAAEYYFKALNTTDGSFQDPDTAPAAG